MVNLVGQFAFGVLVALGVMHQDAWPFIVGAVGCLAVAYDAIYPRHPDPHKDEQ